jgi:peptidoglycan/LPS O-acetylase OafA/YrhL
VATTDQQWDRSMTLPKLGHVAALDGIRGLAVGIVVLHHLRVPGIHGGWLGVDLFFALSGFLITESVLGMGTGAGRLASFWKRRAWRLGPALAVMLGWYAAWWFLGDIEGQDGRMRLTWLASSAGQVLNIHDAWSRSGPFSDYLGHLWSLSAEVQFYVVWALLLHALVRTRAPRFLVLLVPVGLFVASTVERGVMAAHHVQWNRLYLGPDTRSTALWAGCIVGLLHFWGAFDRSPVLRPAAKALVVPAFVALAALVALPSMNFSLERAPYVWGLTVIGLSAGVLVAAGASVQGGVLRPLLEARPLEWLGRISYSVYLWHVPLIAELRRTHPDLGTPTEVAIIVPAALLAGWLSYVVIERPLLSATGRARLVGRLRRAPAPVG